MDPNERQVGGTHYKSEYQHWDFAIDLHLNYLEGQITRYLMRYRRPDGGEGEKDLQKALHYLDKLISVHERFRSEYFGGQPRGARQAYLNMLAKSNKLTFIETATIGLVVTWTTLEELQAAHEGIKELIEHYRRSLVVIEPNPVPLTEENHYAERDEPKGPIKAQHAVVPGQDQLWLDSDGFPNFEPKDRP